MPSIMPLVVAPDANAMGAPLAAHLLYEAIGVAASMAAAKGVADSAET